MNTLTDALNELQARAGSPDDLDRIDWSQSPIARMYPRSDGFLSYRSPGQQQRPPSSRTPAAHRMSADRPR